MKLHKKLWQVENHLNSKQYLMKNIFLFLFVQSFYIVSTAQQKTTGFTFTDQKELKQMDVLWNDKILTSYCFYDSVMKPVLFPVNTLDGITITRGYPVAPRPGDRTDHPHHVGIWMNYESVNGLDFWNNSTAITADKKSLYGTIRQQEITNKIAGKQTASFTALANWQRPDGHILLKEKTIYHFTVKDEILFIDRITTLTANDIEVKFKDVKDGFFAIRVARELEMPSQQADVFVDAQGIKTLVPKINNEGITGMYIGSDGSKGDSVWSTKGPWTILTGKKEGKNITIGIIDHPENVGYPTYWHARGYGLFSANPLGRKVFSNGKEELNFSLKPNMSTTFKYRVVIASGKEISTVQMNKLADDFGKIK